MNLDKILKPFIKVGTLNLIDSKGKMHQWSGEPGPSATIRLLSQDIERELIKDPEMALGEGYMKGLISIEKGDLYNLLDLATQNISHFENQQGFFKKSLYKFYQLFDGFRYYNPKRSARRNAKHHYDLSDELYQLFLDEDRQYSCAYFKDQGDSLEQAQMNKKLHIANKLRLEPGMSVLDIGSGWGGMAIFLAKHFDVDVVGLTLSEKQQKMATERAAKAGLAKRVKFYLRDFRDEKENYDRIVSVGMFEHVGPLHYQTFFKKAYRLLNEDGIMLLHSIGCRDPRPTSAWFQKYIFPGGYVPALSDVIPKIEKTQWYIADIELLYHHYAETLRQWRSRFLSRREKVKELYDETFCRMWEFYLTASEAGFRNRGLMVFQIQMARNPKVIPMTRDYMYPENLANAGSLEDARNLEHLKNQNADGNKIVFQEGDKNNFQKGILMSEDLQKRASL